MEAIGFEPGDGVAFAVRLLNTWDELEPDPECLRDVEVVRRFLARHGFADAARLAGDADVESLRSLRGRLAHAWDAADEETAVAELNAILAAARAQPWLERQDVRSDFRYDRPGVPIREFADALSSRALLDEIAAGRWPRFGRCDAGPCRCAFIDRTRNGVRRYSGSPRGRPRRRHARKRRSHAYDQRLRVSGRPPLRGRLHRLAVPRRQRRRRPGALPRRSYRQIVAGRERLFIARGDGPVATQVGRIVFVVAADGSETVPFVAGHWDVDITPELCAYLA